MGDTAGTKLREPIETRRLTTEYVNKTCILTCILQYLNRKNVLRANILMAKCFITTNFTARLSQGAMNIDLKTDNLDRVSTPRNIVATFDVEHPIHGTTYGPK